MRFSSAQRDRFVRIATGAGLALALAVLALASPTPAMAEGRIRIAEQYGNAIIQNGRKTTMCR